jgi:hypothetical protein
MIRRVLQRLLPLMALLAVPAYADDFDPRSTDWTGLSALVETAAMVNLQLEVRDILDWSKLDEHDVLFLVAPRVAPEGEALRSLQRFVDAGGRLIVADDFAQGGAWLHPFGLELEPHPGGSIRTFEDIPTLPQVEVDPDESARNAARRWMAPSARISPSAFLSHNLHAPIVLNHPGSLRIATTSGVLWGHFRDPGLAWLAEADHGAGRVLALADPSALINGMLGRLHDNKQFAANVMRYYCVLDRPCRVTLLANLERVQGVFQAKEDAPGRQATLRSGLEQIEKFLRWLEEALRGPWTGPALLLMVLVMLGVPVVRLARAPAPLLPPEPQGPRTDSILAETVGAWLSHEQADYRRPARLLASHLARVVERIDRQETPLRTGNSRHGEMRATGFGLQLRPQAIDSLVRAGQCSEQAGQRLRDVFQTLQKVAQEEGEAISRARFGQLAAEVEWAESLIRHTGASSRGGMAESVLQAGE